MARRRSRNRAALVAAAQEFLASDRESTSIHDLTASADIGFGSFYTYFTSKDDLLEEALLEVLRTHGERLDQLTTGLADPVEVVATLLRGTCRLRRTEPQLVRVLLNHGLPVLRREEGLGPRARRGIAAAVHSGAFPGADPVRATMVAGGALFGALHLLDDTPTLDDDEVGQELTAGLLVMFGTTTRKARAIASRTLREPAQN